MKLTYTLYLYYKSKLPDNENYILDCSMYDSGLYSIYNYFEEHNDGRIKIDDFQLQKIQLQDIFVVNLNERYAQQLASEIYNYNYCLLVNSLGEIIPYRITKILWNGTAACKLIVKMDVGTYIYNARYNTGYFNSAIIERAHKDRFSGKTTINGVEYLIPDIDYHEEPIDTPVKYLNDNEKIADLLSVTVKWNVVYYSDPDSDTGVRTFIVPDESDYREVKLATSSYLAIEGNTYYVIRKIDNPYITLTYDGNTISFDNDYLYEEIHIYDRGGTILVRKYGWNESSAETGGWHGLSFEIIQDLSGSAVNVYYNTDLTYYIVNRQLLRSRVYRYASIPSTPFPVLPASKQTLYLNTQTGFATLSGLDDFNLTNPRIIKIVSCPFLPVTLTSDECLLRNIADDYMNVTCVEWISNKDFPLKSIISLSQDLLQRAPASYYEQPFDIFCETKLLNSNYTEVALEYNSYKLILPFELYAYTTQSGHYNFDYDVKYKQSKLRSDLLFKMDVANYTKLGGLLNATSNYLVSDIDNEKPIFNNEYINYIKNGYNYDKENMNRQTVTSAMLSGVQVAGGVAGIAAGALTGGISAAAGISLVTSGLTNMINIINSRIAAENSIKQKLTSYRNSSTGIAGVNALDLRKEYEANDLYKRTYEMPSEMRDTICNFFRFYGYQLNEFVDDLTLKDYENSRLYYNFIKLKDIKIKPEFKSEFVKNSEIIDELVRIYNEGVTIYHIKGGYDDFDFDKEYENYEKFLA